jgi:predicted transcriptional regulator of viral defense system
MQIEPNTPRRTIGPRTAQLLNGLYQRATTTFTLADAQGITRLSPKLASSLLHKAARRGLVSRLKSGLYAIVPPELGDAAQEYLGDPYLAAVRLAGDAPVFLSHGSAMEIHRMVTQPRLTVTASSPKRLRNRTLHGAEFRFVLVRPEHCFGVTKHWVTKQTAVAISDLPRTVLDGLRQPEYCGGVTEAAKGLWMRRADIDVRILIDYALRMEIGAVIRRLGYLLEFYALAPASELDRLRASLSSTYLPLDPLLPKEGTHLRRWRIQLNIPPEEVEAIRST